MTQIRVAVVGPNGRMGATLVELVHDHDRAVVAAKVIPAGEQGGQLLEDVDPRSVDVMIDFSHRVAVQDHAHWCATHGVSWVLGTTGLTSQDENAVDKAAERSLVFRASNFSVGVALLNDLAAKASRVLGTDADVEIVESHHHHKHDAPSGTALTLAETVATARGQVLSEVVTHGRSGLIGARPRGEIGMHALRLADVVGRHELHFGWGNEGLVITHEARDRRVFAAGALRAALWCVQAKAAGRSAGLVGMTDLLKD